MPSKSFATEGVFLKGEDYKDFSRRINFLAFKDVQRN